MGKRKRNNNTDNRPTKRRKIDKKIDKNHIYVDAHTFCDVCNTDVNSFLLCYASKEHRYCCLNCSHICYQCDYCKCDRCFPTICNECEQICRECIQTNNIIRLLSPGSSLCNVCKKRATIERCIVCRLSVCTGCSYDCSDRCGRYCNTCSHFCWGC